MGPKPFLPNEVKFTCQNCSLSAQHRTCTKREKTKDLFAVLQSARSFRSTRRIGHNAHRCLTELSYNNVNINKTESDDRKRTDFYAPWTIGSV